MRQFPLPNEPIVKLIVNANPPTEHANSSANDAKSMHSFVSLLKHGI